MLEGVKKGDTIYCARIRSGRVDFSTQFVKSAGPKQVLGTRDAACSYGADKIAVNTGADALGRVWARSEYEAVEAFTREIKKMKSREFQTGELERLTNNKHSKVQQLIKEGFVAPSIQRAEGHGTRNLWSFNDLRDLVVFDRLVRLGIRREAAACIIETGMFPRRDFSGRENSVQFPPVALMRMRGQAEVELFEAVSFADKGAA